MSVKWWAGIAAIAYITVLVVVLALPFGTSVADREVFYREGYQAGAHGIPHDACPYYSGGECAYECWKKGWIDARLHAEGVK